MQLFIRLGPFFSLHSRQRNKVSGESEGIERELSLNIGMTEFFVVSPFGNGNQRAIYLSPSFSVRLWRAAKRGGVTNESNAY